MGLAPGLGSVAAGLLLLAAFALVEGRTKDALVPLRLFANRGLVTAIGVILVFQSALGGAYYLFTTYLQGVLGYEALEAGLAFVPLTVISMVSRRQARAGSCWDGGEYGPH